MTDHAVPCTIRGCRNPADLSPWCCSACAETMRRQLREIEDYAAVLTAEPGRGGTGGTRRASGFGSRPPARLDVIAAMDPRTVSHALGDDDTDGDVRSILGGLDQLARWVVEETGDVRATHRPTVTTETRYLRGRIAWCAGRQWIDELADDLHELHATARRLAGDAPPRPLAPCPDCAGPLWPVGDTDTIAVRCGDCGATYDGLALLNLGQQLDTTKGAA
ncbi:hypothetical protein [Saccharopolyspora sp. 6V]|uniref:hypothetical protein n=1 Tax=Saccharopolyspora sp. 6V TaxID=2877239 RepID=UPI001CD2778C|nr:hypothetical protein [Saccharopolyspora sp. 6V]MCA1195117.1 hypothetical protein [Saccharopolyspora sp. 6V]